MNILAATPRVSGSGITLFYGVLAICFLAVVIGIVVFIYKILTRPRFDNNKLNDEMFQYQIDQYLKNNAQNLNTMDKEIEKSDDKIASDKISDFEDVDS